MSSIRKKNHKTRKPVRHRTLWPIKNCHQAQLRGASCPDWLDTVQWPYTRASDPRVSTHGILIPGDNRNCLGLVRQTVPCKPKIPVWVTRHQTKRDFVRSILKIRNMNNYFTHLHVSWLCLGFDYPKPLLLFVCLSNIPCLL